MLAALSVIFLKAQEISDSDVGSVVSNFSERAKNFRFSDVGSVVSDFSQITENFSKFDGGSEFAQILKKIQVKQI